MSRKPNIEQMLLYLDINITPEMKKLVSALKKADSIDENKLAEQMKMRVNDIRKLMYELSVKGLVKYTKNKSDDNQWWYIYLWHLDADAIKHNWITKKVRELDQKIRELEEERSNVFRCNGCGLQFKQEDALDAGYICSQCGGVLTDIKRRVNAAQLEREIKEIKKNLEVFNK